MKALKKLTVFVLALCCCLSAVSCKNRPVNRRGIAAGSIDITAETLPEIIVTENYSYLGYSLAAALLRVSPDENIGTAEAPKTVKELVTTVITADECYNALNSGSADIAICIEPDADIINALPNAGVTYQTVNLATEELVFYTGPGCGVDTLTKEQLISLFNGETVNWKDLGGNNQAISAFLPKSDSFEYSWFENEFGNLKTKPNQPVDIYSSAEGIFSAAANYDNRAGAIGFSLLSNFSNTTLGGTKTMLKITDGENEIVFKKNICIATRNGLDPVSDTAVVLNWLDTDQGRVLIDAMGTEVAK